MPAIKKNILLFGANSFIAKSFIAHYSDDYNIHPVYRNDVNGLSLDFNNTEEIRAFCDGIGFSADAIFFLQGINPSMGASQITEEHFLKMMRVNLVSPVLLLAGLKEKMAGNCLVLFISSIAKRKGSYDPSYASAKSAMTGLMYSLANAYPAQRFNTISLGLVEGSPVFEGMSEDFRARHASRMQNGNFVKAENVIMVMDMLVKNTNINTADIAIDSGYN